MITGEFDAIKRTNLFAGLGDREFDEIIGFLQPNIRLFRKGENIIQPDDLLTGIGLILAGRISSYIVNANGDRLLLFVAEQGEIIGDLSPALGGRPVYITMTADEDSVVVFIKPALLADYNGVKCDTGHLVIIHNLLLIITKRCCHLYQRMMVLTMKSVRQKVCSFLLEQRCTHGKAVFILSLNRNKLAEYLNIPRPSLSRELCLLRDGGVIDFYRSTFHILDLSKLKQYASGNV